MNIAYKHKSGSFIDFEGVEHKVVVAIAIETLVNEECDCDKITKYSIGMSITNPTDKFDYNLGLEIAKGKATTSEDFIISNYVHRLPELALEALMDDTLALLQSNPGKYIKGYDKAKQKYEDNKLEQEMLNKLTEEEKAALNNLKLSKNAVDYIKRFKVFE